MNTRKGQGSQDDRQARATEKSVILWLVYAVMAWWVIGFLQLQYVLPLIAGTVDYWINGSEMSGWKIQVDSWLDAIMFLGFWGPVGFLWFQVKTNKR